VKILVDGDAFSITGHVTELLMAAGLAQDGIEHRRIDGGASAHAVRISLELDSGAKRALAAMSDVRQSNATSPANLQESDADSRYRVIKVSEAAKRHQVDPRTILRWMERDPSMIASVRPYRLDPIPLDAYAAGRPTRYRRAA
jgi:hypothetical protein